MQQTETLRVVIADDERLARRMLASLLAQEPDIEIVAQCGNGPDTIDAVREHAPDVLFLDVNMPGATGIEVLAAIGADAGCAVVLVTAFDEYAIAAFEHHALDYILKPVDEDRFRGTVRRVRERLHEKRAASLAQQTLHALASMSARGREPQRYLDRIVVRATGRVSVVDVADIDWVQAADDYLEVHAAGHVHLVRGSMSALEARLDPADFVRIHRSTIVRLGRVRELEPYFHGDYAVTLVDGTKLRLSRTYRSRFQAALGEAI